MRLSAPAEYRFLTLLLPSWLDLAWNFYAWGGSVLLLCNIEEMGVIHKREEKR
jgi:hypothetical protein